MSKRLQVILDDEELAAVQRAARARRQTVAEWVRGALRDARRADERRPVEEKLRTVREASARYAFPTGPIEQMNAEISRGYEAGDPS
jgi:hypothetical protein